MNLFDLYEVSRQPRRAKSLFDRARKYIGAVKAPLKPKNTAARRVFTNHFPERT